jgi:hypothetical protein
VTEDGHSTCSRITGSGYLSEMATIHGLPSISPGVTSQYMSDDDHTSTVARRFPGSGALACTRLPTNSCRSWRACEAEADSNQGETVGEGTQKSQLQSPVRGTDIHVGRCHTTTEMTPFGNAFFSSPIHREYGGFTMVFFAALFRICFTCFPWSVKF